MDESPILLPLDDESCRAPGEPAPVLRPRNVFEDILFLYVRPTALFAELPQHNRSAAALLVLIVAQMVFGMAVVSTGVIDYEIDVATGRQVSRFIRENDSKENPEQVTAMVDALEKGAVFTKLLTRLSLVIGGPVRLLLGIGILGGLLFVTVALTGGKPDFRLLAGVLVFASFTQVPELALRAILVAQLEASRVELSAAAFAPGPEIRLAAYVLLRRLDPFALWSWALVGIGICVTGQLRVRTAVIAVTLLALSVGVLNAIGDVTELADFSGMTFGAN